MMIRQATEEDIQHLVPLMIEYIVDFYKRPNPGEHQVAQLVKELLDRPDYGTQFVAEDGAGIVGFATVYYTFSTLRAKRAAILNDLYVRPSGRGNKIGESLFLRCLDHVRARACAGMQWETAKDNVIAQSLYKKMGGHLGEWLVYEIE